MSTPVLSQPACGLRYAALWLAALLAGAALSLLLCFSSDVIPTKNPAAAAARLAAHSLYSQHLLMLWNPRGDLAGCPLLADGRIDLFYPTSLLHRWRLEDRAFAAGRLINLTLAGAGMMLLATAAGAKKRAGPLGLVFMFSLAPIIDWPLGHGLVWLGWTCWAQRRLGQRRSWADVMLLLAFLLPVALAGSSLALLMVMAALAATWLAWGHWRDITPALLALAAAIALSAMQWLPRLSWSWQLASRHWEQPTIWRAWLMLPACEGTLPYTLWAAALALAGGAAWLIWQGPRLGRAGGWALLVIILLLAGAVVIPAGTGTKRLAFDLARAQLNQLPPAHLPSPLAGGQSRWIAADAKLLDSRRQAWLAAEQSPTTRSTVLLDAQRSRSAQDLQRDDENWWKHRGPGDGQIDAPVIQSSPLREQMQIELPATAGWLVWPEGYDDGWLAWQKNRPLPILCAYGRYRAMPIDGSGGRLTMSYQPPAWRRGVYISSATACLLLLLSGIKLAQAAKGTLHGSDDLDQ